MEDDLLRKQLDDQAWPEIYAALYAFALYRSRSKVDAKDLAQRAIARVYAYDSKWDPQREPLLLKYLMSVVNTLLSNERTSAAAKRNVSMSLDGARASAERVRDDHAFSEDKAVEGDLFTRRLVLLKARLAEDAQATRILELALDGTDAPAEILLASGWPPKVATAARLRMQRHAALVARDLGECDDDDLPSFDERDDDLGELEERSA